MKIGTNSKKGESRRYKDDELAGRLNKAASARSATLAKFRAKPGADDPAEIQRRAARQEIVKARDFRTAARSAEEARKIAERSAHEAAEQARRLVQEQQDAAKSELHRAKQKAYRDARYAARKQRKK